MRSKILALSVTLTGLSLTTSFTVLFLDVPQALKFKLCISAGLLVFASIGFFVISLGHSKDTTK